MEKKSGFLANANKLGNSIIHYQCKSCLSFLASTSKWDRHLTTCFSNTSVESRPIGFRMVTFTTPTLPLERIRLEENLRITGTTAASELDPVSDPGSPSLVNRKPGRPRKSPSSSPNFNSRPIQDKNGDGSGQEQIVRKRGRPRKVLLINASTDNEHKTEAKLLAESLVIADGGKRMRKSREEWSQYQFQSPGPDVPNITVKKRKRRPRKISLMGSIPSSSKSNQLAKNTAKNARKSAALMAVRRQRIKNAQNDVTSVRSFKYACPKCPAKFDTQGFYNTHVNNIHNGKRRLMTCCVCDRIFNKRDSLNNHYLAHEAAEAKEEKFNLFQPWTDECLEKVKLYRSHSSSNFNRQQCCKICFITHYTHHSYLTHFRQEHADPPESYRVTCKFDKCSEEFRSIRVYLDHAKANHARQFFGNLTLLRQQEGIFVGNRRVPVDEDGKLLYKQRVWPSKPKTNSGQCRKAFKKRVSSFTPRENEGSDWEEENGISFDSTEMDDDDEEEDEIQPEMPCERKIELERVHLGEDYVVKHEVDWNVKVEVDQDQIILPDEPEKRYA